MFSTEAITGPDIAILLMLGFLILCALVATLCKRLFTTVLLFMSFSLVMACIWLVLESPDLAGTESAVGAGVTTILFILVLRKIAAIDTRSRNNKQFGRKAQGEDTDRKSIKSILEEVEEVGLRDEKQDN